MQHTKSHKTARPLSTFHGGLKLAENKYLSNGSSISALAQSSEYIIPLQQHIGVISEPMVKPGERVLKGQMLAKPGNLVSAAIHSPVSGVVKDITDYDVPHPSGLADRCIIIENDFTDEWVARNPVGDEYNHTTSSNLRKIIRDAGIVGLGGATFPAAVKQTEMHIKTLILNGAECEPYITCDDMLMREHAKEILSGGDIIGHVIKARECIIAIEDNKPEAIKAIQAAIDSDGTGFFQLRVVPTLYPSGGEKQLIKILIGKEVPAGKHPVDLSILVHNVATAYAIHRAIYYAEPLISRVVTVTGPGISQPQNLEVLIGTRMDALIKHCGGYTENHDKLIMGGPMMGFSLNTDTLPVVKATNCLLVTASDEAIQHQKQMPCIRCGRCVEACPANLLPQQLYWYASTQNTERLTAHHLFDCIECGCCSYVCPSNIPLVQYYRYAKTMIWQQERERKFSDISRQRHEAHQQRLEQQKREREEKLRQKRELLKDKAKISAAGDKAGKQAAIAEALARAQAKKEQRQNNENSDSNK